MLGPCRRARAEEADEAWRSRTISTGSSTDENVAKAPDEPGVYILYDDGRMPSYVGMSADSIRTRLQSHQRGDEVRCTHEATTYKRERTPASAAAGRERQLLMEHEIEHAEPPRCNEVRP